MSVLDFCPGIRSDLLDSETIPDDIGITPHIQAIFQQLTMVEHKMVFATKLTVARQAFASVGTWLTEQICKADYGDYILQAVMSCCKSRFFACAS
jgi:hypothetical protein